MLDHVARRRDARRKAIVTPEGMRLDFVVAPFGERASAFLIDAVIVTVASTAPMLVAFALESDWATPIALLAFFLVRTFYFTWFEVRWKGSTPGKRRLGLRVIQADGGPLATESVVARNLMRELELFLPLAAFAAPDQLWPGAPGWARLLATGWLLVFALLPLFNRDRLRIGDMVAGTLVVHAPKAVLLQDVGSSAGAFTPEQLDVYGVYELQVLEDVLRGAAESPNRAEALAAVAARIQRKIRWSREVAPPEPEAFLREFYTALRAHLERKMLFGRKKADKFAA